MSEQALRRILEGGGGAGGKLLRAALWPIGQLYGLSMAARRSAYRRGILPSRKAGAPVISVGNLVAGGTGKTPFTLMLARLALEMGRQPAVLLRGYRQRQNPSGISDEAELYQRLLPGLRVEVGADRLISAARAVAGGADLLLLDDGFQHLRLQRDRDVLLIDATSPWGGGTPLPGGLLREFRGNLRLADLVVVTRSDHIPPEALSRLKTDITSLCPAKPILTARHKPTRLRQLDGKSLGLECLKGKRVLAMAGIARPESFSHTLEQLGARIVETIEVADHANLTGAFLAAALRRCRDLDACLVISEKDWARLDFSLFSCPLETKTVDKPVEAPIHMLQSGTMVGGDNKSTKILNDMDLSSIWALGVDMEVAESASLQDWLARILKP